MYQIRFMPRAEKYIKKLKERDLKEKIKNAIYEIQKNPYIGKLKKRRPEYDIWIRCILS